MSFRVWTKTGFIRNKSAIIYSNFKRLPQFVRRQYTSDMSTKETEAKELRFAVPYGQIAAKEWGNPSGLPVLAIHGWLDNAGSFDPLIPQILRPNDLHIIAIDQPGSGLSSHIPPGCVYGRWHTLLEIKRVVDHLKWQKFTILGHSQGGQLGLLFAAIYPELVARVISIDLLKPFTFEGRPWVNTLVQNSIQGYINYESYLSEDQGKNNIPVYSEEETWGRLREAYANSLTEESTRILMKRGTKKVKDGFTFTRDIRLKYSSLEPPPTDDQIFEFLSNLKIDLLVIRGKQSYIKIPDSVKERFYDMYRSKCRIFKDVLLEGSHHLHMNNPETVGPVINEFIAESLSSQT